jgi:hypothetical protein
MRNRPDPDVAFHWAPTSRRAQIIRHGLRPRMRPTVSSPGWRPPFICLSPTPYFAWRLSGDLIPASSVPAWDLWEVDLEGALADDVLDGVEVLPGWDEGFVREIRAYSRIPKRYVWHAGTRER